MNCTQRGIKQSFSPKRKVNNGTLDITLWNSNVNTYLLYIFVGIGISIRLSLFFFKIIYKNRLDNIMEQLDKLTIYDGID